MPKISFEKKGLVSEIAKKVSSSADLLVTNHQRLTVEEIEKIRKELSSISASYLGVKNTLFKIVLRKNREGLSFDLNGQTGVCCGNSIEELSKVLVSFKKKHPNLIIQGGIIGNDFFPSQYIEKVAILPSREVLIAMFSGFLQSPLINFACLLKEHLRRLLRTIEEIKKLDRS